MLSRIRSAAPAASKVEPTPNGNVKRGRGWARSSMVAHSVGLSRMRPVPRDHPESLRTLFPYRLLSPRPQLARTETTAHSEILAALGGRESATGPARYGPRIRG